MLSRAMTPIERPQPVCARNLLSVGRWASSTLALPTATFAPSRSICRVVGLASSGEIKPRLHQLDHTSFLACRPLGQNSAWLLGYVQGHEAVFGLREERSHKRYILLGLRSGQRFWVCPCSDSFMRSVPAFGDLSSPKILRLVLWLSPSINREHRQRHSAVRLTICDEESQSNSRHVLLCTANQICGSRIISWHHVSRQSPLFGDQKHHEAIYVPSQ